MSVFGCVTVVLLYMYCTCVIGQWVSTCTVGKNVVDLCSNLCYLIIVKACYIVHVHVHVSTAYKITNFTLYIVSTGILNHRVYMYLSSLC